MVAIVELERHVDSLTAVAVLCDHEPCAPHVIFILFPSVIEQPYEVCGPLERGTGVESLSTGPNLRESISAVQLARHDEQRLRGLDEQLQFFGRILELGELPGVATR